MTVRARNHPLVRLPTQEQIRQAKIDQMIADCSDEDLADLKPLAMAKIADPRSRALLADKRVRESRWLRALVYDVLTEQIGGRS
jgi:hypothetical protein